MHYRTIFWVALLLGFMMTPSCKQNHRDADAREKQLNECVGKESNALLNRLTAAFDDFLVDNRFCRTKDELLSGYKNWLQYLLDQKGLDSTWKFRYEVLDSLVTDMEKTNFAEMLYSQKFSECVMAMEYPDDWILAHYREIMPQHSVSPQKFAEEFVKNADQKQFDDPVIRKIIALEYFLGPILHILRPDSLYMS